MVLRWEERKMKKLICKREKYILLFAQKKKINKNFTVLFTDKFYPLVNEIYIINMFLSLVIIKRFFNEFFSSISEIYITDESRVGTSW